MNSILKVNTYIYEPLLGCWCIYLVDGHGQKREAVCRAYTEEMANTIVTLLNGSAMTVNDTLELALKKLDALYSRKSEDCDPDDYEQWDHAITACRGELLKMRAR